MLNRCGGISLPYSWSVRTNSYKGYPQPSGPPGLWKRCSLNCYSATAGGKVGEASRHPADTNTAPGHRSAIHVALRGLPLELRPRDALWFQNESSDVVWSTRLYYKAFAESKSCLQAHDDITTKGR